MDIAYRDKKLSVSLCVLSMRRRVVFIQSQVLGSIRSFGRDAHGGPTALAQAGGLRALHL
jgi:hypothetical protein